MAPTLDSMSSAEAELDRVLEDIIAKMVAGTATPQDVAQYHELAARRAKLMRPSTKRIDRLRDAYQRRASG
jgi:hypothetical protein